MNVVDIISLMRTQGIGENFNDAELQKRYLLYLNLAHDELYTETAEVNSDVQKLVTLSNVAGQNFITLPEEASTVVLMLQPGKQKGLEFKTYSNFVLYKSKGPSYGDPMIAFRQKKKIMFYPYVGNAVLNFDVIYAPERTPLTINTIESQIPYPTAYHRILADGGLYYVFQDEGGFRSPEKESKAELRWRSGIQKLITYFTGTSQQIIRTFSEI